MTMNSARIEPRCVTNSVPFGPHCIMNSAYYLLLSLSVLETDISSSELLINVTIMSSAITRKTN